MSTEFSDDKIIYLFGGNFAMKEVRVALIGFGGIARSHNAGYRILAKEGAPIKLVAVCDINPAQFEAALSINIATDNKGLPADIHTYTSVDELIAKEDFDMADICLPSYLHKEYAIKLMEAGKHVLSEKPMALCSADCDDMIEVSKRTGRKLMIGQCLRFDSAYLYLKDCVDSGKFGKVRHVFMHHLSPQPRWGFEHWFEDDTKSGGCVLDMHIHDVDMVRFLFGEPDAVSMYSIDGDTRWAVENTRIYYKDKLVSINGSWGEAATVKFRAGYRVRFDDATVVFELGEVTVYPEKGEIYKPEIKKTNHMAEEIRMFAGTILDESIVNTANPPESARETVKLIEKLRESAARNGEIVKL